MLTISQLASFVGVTVRAVRHYHARGLLPEPARDTSGYRRYGARAVIDLVRIKTLADAGVPLSRVSELLDADPDRFARAVEQIDRDLQHRIAALQTHRSRVTSLVGGDGLVLPEDVVDHLSLLRAIGISERGVRTERDGWVLMAARYPERVAVWIEHKRLAFEDPTFRELYLAFDQAFDWPPDDPRVAELAGAWCAFIAGLDPTVREVATAKPAEAGVDDAAVALLKSQQDSTSPTWDRLAELVERKLGRSGIW